MFNKETVKVQYLALGIIFIGFIALGAKQIIHPVWDENSLLYELIPQPLDLTRLWNEIQRIWTQTTLYRPLVFSLLMVVSYLNETIIGNLSFFRWFNIIALLGCGVLLISFYQGWSRVWAAAVFFGSASALICAGWSANVFDVLCTLLCLSCYVLWQRSYFISAGLCLGMAAFCKEIALLGTVGLGMLWLANWPKKHRAYIGFAIALLLQTIYIIARNNVIPLWSNQDIHGFQFSKLPDQLYVMSVSLLSQTVDFPWPWLSGALLVVMLIIAHNWRFTLATTGVIGLSALIYNGMLCMVINLPLINAANFAGRLYLLPWVLILLANALYNHRRALILAIAAPAVILSGSFAALRNIEMQQSYAQLDQEAVLYQKRTSQPYVLYIYPDIQPLNRPHLKLRSDLNLEYEFTRAQGLVQAKTLLDEYEHQHLSTLSANGFKPSLLTNLENTPPCLISETSINLNIISEQSATPLHLKLSTPMPKGLFWLTLHSEKGEIFKLRAFSYQDQLVSLLNPSGLNGRYSLGLLSSTQQTRCLSTKDQLL